MLSRRVIAYYGLIRASRPLPATYLLRPPGLSQTRGSPIYSACLSHRAAPRDGDTDGLISREDLESVARGDYNKAEMRKYFQEKNLDNNQVNKKMKKMEDTARYLLDGKNKGLYNRIDIANDDERKIDGNIRRGDVDKSMLSLKSGENKARNISDIEKKEARQTYERLQNPEEQKKLTADLERGNLSRLSSGELMGIAALAKNDPELKSHLEGALTRDVNNMKQLKDLPDSLGYQMALRETLLDGSRPEDKERSKVVSKLEDFIGDEVSTLADKRLSDRKGDREADLSLARMGEDIASLRQRYPALDEHIAAKTEEVMKDRSDQVSDIRKADDSWLSKAAGTVTGGIKDLMDVAGDVTGKAIDFANPLKRAAMALDAVGLDPLAKPLDKLNEGAEGLIKKGTGLLADGVRLYGKGLGEYFSAPLRMVGKAADFAVTMQGKIAGAGLDAIGADGAADFVRDKSAMAGDAMNAANDFLARQQKNFINGVAEVPEGLVEAAGVVATDPGSVFKGAGKLITDPVSFFDSYKDVYKKHGLSGLIGYTAGDVALAIATGGAAEGAGKALASGGTRGVVAREALNGAASSLGNSTARSVASELVSSLNPISSLIDPLKGKSGTLNASDMTTFQKGTNIAADGLGIEGYDESEEG